MLVITHTVALTVVKNCCGLWFYIKVLNMLFMSCSEACLRHTDKYWTVPTRTYLISFMISAQETA